MSLEKPKVKRKRSSIGKSKKLEENMFIVQEHQAKQKHWDFRLQVGSKMVSWAIPKGPSLNPKTPRLAVKTQDHAPSYNDFEGIIAKGLYGAGKVMQWDKGLYEVDGDIKESIKHGLIKFRLKGYKLRGKWALIKTGNRWLLIKLGDKYASRSVDILKKHPQSIKSGKKVREITKKDGYIEESKDLGF